ncbi:DUF2314 domain-containing protein [Hymenobacter sp. BT507]|uniref:DUF2314 domain-containing protein n=1 Tax=Hymenobacter citatus TaxID=2763506 RepID=A0ABR7MIY9_9BACT|nr:DUF2314 domain-containing protein [Hymenobacter citatus]MBC6611056.1 DUF2314 domain-containing protein [Hymenobacter citatus]
MTATVLFRVSLLLGLLTGVAPVAQAQQKPANNAPLAAHAPTDQPLAFATTDAARRLRELDMQIASAVKQARTTLPSVKKRFQTGLPEEQVLFLTTRLYDADGTFEQVFVRVRTWSGTTVQGIIANELLTVQSFTQGQQITFPEKAVLDWTISLPDGSEEGNFVGKLLDSLPR